MLLSSQRSTNMGIALARLKLPLEAPHARTHAPTPAYALALIGCFRPQQDLATPPLPSPCCTTPPRA